MAIVAAQNSIQNKKSSCNLCRIVFVYVVSDADSESFDFLICICCRNVS